ncbi:MAG: ureidoglycolate dehydrogenase [Candidatus Harrisonbacteria bacterium CG10_big_fil_rev_8_21_14_0_10_45_28]|uniref:Ureidoglycolate dehydrogenase n=1 Tax=Candidatus Harrisonbacteria bacterium CG10_big_fil_rev_8_21_14_0_10_45_28 TaxID=1974586 RepID=A0A2H0UPG2_9BACT|nr:MAG: ureidoglycolate dehydrogenase [Candidatus Harrisonbacteria bacterium CG10_big_fil_rev_8_21_14_0_10_45_28]
MEKIKRIPHLRIQKSIFAMLVKTGVSLRDASSMADGLVSTSLRGTDSHGIRLTPHYLKVIETGRVNPRAKMTVKKTAPSIAIVDAKHGFNIVASKLAMAKAIELAEKTGMGAVAIKDSTHFAVAGIYGLEAVKNNTIGFSFTHTDALVVPFGGKDPVLGTNPICFTAPMAGEEPFCSDMATMPISWNKVRMHQSTKESLSPGWVVDSEGREVINPLEAVSLLPFGGYKGYGLSLMVEVLCSLLSGMPFGRDIKTMFPPDSKRRHLGYFVMALDIKKFVPIKEFKIRFKKELDKIRKTRPVVSGKKVLVAGDPEKIAFKDRSKNGIPMSVELIEEFNTWSKKLGIKERV